MKRAMIQNLAFDAQGLISAVIQLRDAGRILAKGSMNAEALMRSLQTGCPHLYEPGPPSKVERWAPADREVRIADVWLSEPDNFLLVLVDWILADSASRAAIDAAPESLVGSKAGTESLREATLEAALRLDLLVQATKGLRGSNRERSATASLFAAGLDSILLALGANVHEVILAAKNNQPVELKTRMSQVLHTFLVLMVERGLSLDDLVRPLAERAGLDAKNPS